MQPWSHLPNASRIDQLLVHAKANPKEWVAAREAAWEAGWDAGRDAARYAAWVAGWDAAREAAWEAAWVAGWDAAWYAACDAAWVAALALVAWDHSGSLLDLPSDQVLMLSKLGQPAAILMYPAVLAMSDKG
jgi:hypothetical protein